MRRGVNEYNRWFLEEYGHIHCLNEECESPNQTPHSPHHIVARSKAPRHTEIHNHLNLIMLCQVCHDKFHHGNKKDFEQSRRWTDQWKEERGLNKLFEERKSKVNIADLVI